MNEILCKTFDTTANDSISGIAGKYLNIAGIYAVNNETNSAAGVSITFVFTDDTVILYGDSAAGLFLRGNGGDWGLPVNEESVTDPYFKSQTAGAGFLILNVQSRRISGAIWYYFSDT